MQQKLSLSDKEIERVSYAIKLYKTKAFKAPETVLTYMNYIYERSKIEEPTWGIEARKELRSLMKRLK